MMLMRIVVVPPNDITTEVMVEYAVPLKRLAAAPSYRETFRQPGPAAQCSHRMRRDLEFRVHSD